MKDACRKAFLAKSTRLMLAMYLCEFRVPEDNMGQIFTVLGRRKAKILRQDQQNSFSFIQALIPVVESFGLSEELLKQTSGSASTQMMFHGWEAS